eukprot:CAMPEP_0203973164 /NCGR_PEP_ID=MMETSP0359-20131031/99446_1 /ASSEMBLY_ACC=CAM_ASM_000338 /TAXON_ID=268821 /ORGANISM="Scrippsiella Hangoei, Strain SHTV-5" /LENGTH=361 /DNA_ID=CAMNT_0050911311 /DNA_START=28 /DNA_END=1113 /DNA_ORIENTATION=+
MADSMNAGAADELGNGPFYMCGCRLQKNFFVKSCAEHFQYSGDDAAFARQYEELIRNRGRSANLPAVEAVLAEVQAQREERRRTPEEAAKRAQLVGASYKRLHPEVYRLDRERFLHPAFNELVEEMSKCPDKPRAIESCVSDLTSRGLLKPLKRGIWSFPVFTAEFCDLLEAEIAHFEASGLPVARPNSMNRFGVVLRELGMCEEFLDPLVAGCLNPIAVRLLPEFTETLDSYRPFTVKYEATAEGDRDLNLHYDNAEVTLNVNIGGAWTGGQVTFLGLGGAGAGHEDPPPISVALQRGHGVLHAGRELHQAEPVVEGRRQNLILWCRSSGIRNGECPMCRNVPQLVPTNVFAHEGFTGPP